MDCAGCGDCCDPVWLGMTGLELAHDLAIIAAGRRASTADGETNLRFIAEHMVPLAAQPETYVDGLPAAGSGMVAWKCDAFDPATRRCTAHDTRPPICRGYPWYGDAPPADTDAKGAALYPGCSHRWDLEPGARGDLAGRLLPLWPVSARQDDRSPLPS